jgi:hypothetical protein
VSGPAPGPPPLRPFGLRLHHDGRWSHEGQPIRHVRLRAAFDRSVRFLPEEGAGGKYVVQLGRFRGEIEVEEAAFFVREVDLASGTLRLSDGTREALDPASLRVSLRDGALLCTVKRDLAPGGLPARFLPGPQSELLQAVEEAGPGHSVRLGGVLRPLPPF